MLQTIWLPLMTFPQNPDCTRLHINIINRWLPQINIQYLKLRRVKKACIFDTTDLTKRLWKASFCLTSDERGGENTNDKAIDMCQVDMDTWGQRTHADHSSCDRGLNTGCGLGDKRVWPSLSSSPHRSLPYVLSFLVHSNDFNQCVV